MAEDSITEVGIDGTGRLYVTPRRLTFPFIYRAAMEVFWDEGERRLYGAPPRRWSYPRWFQQILAAAADEYGAVLRLMPSTRWVDVPPDVRAEIEQFSNQRGGPSSH